jgi:predicted DNA-binding transcriptional regulator AlpA
MRCLNLERFIMQQLNSALNKTIPEGLANFDQLPNSAFIRLPVLMGLYGISSASCWRGVKNGSIPRPSKLTERTTAWNVGLVRADLALKAKG